MNISIQFNFCIAIDQIICFGAGNGIAMSAYVNKKGLQPKKG